MPYKQHLGPRKRALDAGPLKTLNYVKQHQPVSQLQILRDRGGHSYSHLRQLEKWGYIKREYIGNRNFIITLKENK